MLLLCMAHKGEALEFIQRKFRQEVEFHFRGLYRSDEDMLLISGEGIQNTTMRLTAVYTYFSHQIDRVINMGIAGRLDAGLERNQIYGIRRVLHEYSGNKAFPVYACRETLSKYDCVSAVDRVLDDDYAGRLRRLAPIVDREVWAVGAVCSLFALPFKSYKLISDQAGNQTGTENIIIQAPLYSKHLFDFYKKLSLAKESWKL